MDLNNEKEDILNENTSISKNPAQHKIHSDKYYKNQIIKKNPSIFSFNSDSSFIYETVKLKHFLIHINDPNCLKPTIDEIHFLKEKIIEIIDEKSNNNLIYISPFFSLIIDNLQKTEKKADNTALLIKKIIKDNSNVGNISVRKITERFNSIRDNYNLPKISKTKTHRIIRNVLKYSYRKTKVKNNKLLADNSILSSYTFLKIFIKALSLNLKPVFLDESGFFCQNNNFHTWRNRNEELFFKIDDRKKTNLIMAVGYDKIYYYQLIRKNINTEIFQNFMDNMVGNMSLEEKKNSLIILDNLSVHLTIDLFKFYNEKGLKVLFNVPYKSNWNMIELVFRLIKNLTYKNIYQNINSLEKDILEIIKSGKIENSLKNLYKETLSNYDCFINDNKDLNLNLLTNNINL